MRIAILIDSLESGGAERQALYTLQELGRHGIDVELIFYHRPSHQSYDLSAYDPRRLVFIRKDGNPAGLLHRLAKHLRGNSTHVLYALKETPCLYGAVAAKLAGVPHMLAGHRTVVRPPYWARLGLRLVKRLCSAWVVNTRAVGQALSEMLDIQDGKIEVVHNGIDAAAFRSRLSREEARSKLGISASAQVVSIIAELRPEKKHEMFLQVARQVLEQMPEVVFLVAGAARHDDQVTLPALRDRARALGIERSIRFLGRRADVADILAATDVSVLTSRLEGLSNTILESMTCSVPVVTTNYPGVEEVLTDGQEGFITPQGDEAAMAGRISQLLCDEPLRRRMGSAGYETVRSKFSIEAMGRGLIEVLNRRCGGSSAAASNTRV